MFEKFFKRREKLVESKEKAEEEAHKLNEELERKRQKILKGKGSFVDLNRFEREKLGHKPQYGPYKNKG